MVGLSAVFAIVGYLIGLFGGMFLGENVASNVHDRSMEAGRTGAFVGGRSRRWRSDRGGCIITRSDERNRVLR